MSEQGFQDFLKQEYDVGRLFDKPEPLKGVRVLEVCYVVLGPAACDYMAEFGAAPRRSRRSALRSWK